MTDATKTTVLPLGEITIRNVSKSFGVTKALSNVNFTGYFGEIHAIIGGNGCGKSTLAKVLAGVLPIDSGKVSIKGAHPTTPKESKECGLSMVFQEVLVADESSIVDNLFIGTDGFFGKSMSEKEKQEKARTLLSELAGEPIDPLTPAGQLPLSIKAWITIARGLISNPDVLVLDESSAALDFDSTERLFDKMRELRDKGTAIIIVTHRIAELVRISDRCTVMRDGKDVGVLEKEEITEKNLLRLMTGKEQKVNRSLENAHKTEHTQIALKTENMYVWEDGLPTNFELLKGEIVGITGLDGHGQDDFVRILAGVSNAFKGFTELGVNHGHDFISIQTLDDAKKNGVAFVSGDRKREGILPNLSIIENLGISMYRKHSKIPLLRFIDWTAIADIFSWEVERLSIKTGPHENLITSLSGGNQQKVMLGRAFATHPKILILLDPARGIDLQTKLDLYNQLREFADEGNSVIYMSSELEEFIGFCARVEIFRNGSIFETFYDKQINADGMLESMFGHLQNGGQQKHESSESKISKTPNIAYKNKSDDKEKVEGNVKNYNISNYFNKKPLATTANSKGVEQFSQTDEENFEKLLDSTNSRRLKKLQQTESRSIAPVEICEHSEKDVKAFEKLMNFDNEAKDIKYHRKNTSDSNKYTNSDEQSFKNIVSTTDDRTSESTLVNSIKKEPSSNKSTESRNISADLAEYSEKDMKAFEKLMSFDD
jgi:ribose transport system ATP-binding protein